MKTLGHHENAIFCELKCLSLITFEILSYVVILLVYGSLC